MEQIITILINTVISTVVTLLVLCIYAVIKHESKERKLKQIEREKFQAFASEVHRDWLRRITPDAPPKINNEKLPHPLIPLLKIERDMYYERLSSCVKPKSVFIQGIELKWSEDMAKRWMELEKEKHELWKKGRSPISEMPKTEESQPKFPDDFAQMFLENFMSGKYDEKLYGIERELQDNFQKQWSEFCEKHLEKMDSKPSQESEEGFTGKSLDRWKDDPFKIGQKVRIYSEDEKYLIPMCILINGFDRWGEVAEILRLPTLEDPHYIAKTKSGHIFLLHPSVVKEKIIIKTQR